MKTIIYNLKAVFPGMLFFLFFTFNFYSQEASVAIDINDSSLEWRGCPEFMPADCNISVLHGDPSAGNADVLFKVPANTDIPLHWHNSAERMVLLSGEMDVTYEGEETQQLKPGTYAYGPARKAHTARCKDAGPCILFIAFIGAVDAIEGRPD